MINTSMMLNCPSGHDHTSNCRRNGCPCDEHDHPPVELEVVGPIQFGSLADGLRDEIVDLTPPSFSGDLELTLDPGARNVIKNMLKKKIVLHLPELTDEDMHKVKVGLPIVLEVKIDKEVKEAQELMDLVEKGHYLI